MGQVFVALDPKLDRRVALKVLAIPVDAEDGSQPWAQRLVREARAAASFNHPNVVAIYDVGEHDGHPFIAMELVLGKTLRGFVGKAPEEEIAQRVGWLVDVARGLAAAHARGIVHRDIKPDNVMLTSDGVIKIVDFGIARRTAKPEDASEPTAVGATLTQAGALVGTIRYMAPEQMRCEPLDGRVDQFAWAVMAYELLSGTHPWSGEDNLALAAAMLTRTPEPLRKNAGDVPKHVAEVVDRALSADPEQRFSTMGELTAALGHDSGSGAIAAITRTTVGRDTAATAKPSSTAHKVGIAAAVLLVGSLASAAIWGAVSNKEQPNVSGSASAALPPPMAGVVRVRISPLENASGRAAEDWLGAGLSEALRGKLAALPDVQVELAQGKRSAPTAPNEVEISGTFERSGTTVKVVLSIAQAGALPATIEQSAPMGDLFTLQDSLAAAIAARVRGDLPETASADLRSAGTRNMDAFEAYGKGLAFLNAKRIPDALREFSRAVELDPTYASSRAAMNVTRARSNHLLVKPDGTMVNTVLFTVPASSSEPTWPLATNMGKVLNAWDLEGRPLRVQAETQPNEHFRYTFTLPPAAPGKERKFVYEFQSPRKMRMKDGLGVYSSGHSTSEGGELTTIIELPAGSQVLSVSPIPSQVSMDPSATFVMISERRSPFDSYFMTLLMTADDAAKKTFLEKTPSERLDHLRKLDILPQNVAVGERLAAMAEPSQVCLLANRGKNAEAKAALERFEQLFALKGALPEKHAGFYAHRARACGARAAGDGRAFMRELTLAVGEKGRPHELVQDALFELVDAHLEAKEPGRALGVVKAELARANVFDGPFFSSPPAEDDKNPAALIDLANSNITSGDLDRAQALLGKLDPKARTLYGHLALARLAVARYERGGSDENAAAVKSALVPILSAHPTPWLFADTALLFAHAGRASEGLDLLLKGAADSDYTPPVFDALAVVMTKLPDPEARVGAILTLLRGAGELDYGAHYRLELIAGAVGATESLPEAKRAVVARALFAEAEELLKHTGDAACDRVCQKVSLKKACPVLADLEPKQRETVTRAGACDKR